MGDVNRATHACSTTFPGCTLKVLLVLVAGCWYGVDVPYLVCGGVRVGISYLLCTTTYSWFVSTSRDYQHHRCRTAPACLLRMYHQDDSIHTTRALSHHTRTQHLLHAHAHCLPRRRTAPTCLPAALPPARISTPCPHNALRAHATARRRRTTHTAYHYPAGKQTFGSSGVRAGSATNAANSSRRVWRVARSAHICVIRSFRTRRWRCLPCFCAAANWLPVVQWT